MVVSREKTQAQASNDQEAKRLAVMGRTMPDGAVKISAALNDTNEKECAVRMHDNQRTKLLERRFCGARGHEGRHGLFP